MLLDGVDIGGGAVERLAGPAEICRQDDRSLYLQAAGPTYSPSPPAAR